MTRENDPDDLHDEIDALAREIETKIDEAKAVNREYDGEFEDRGPSARKMEQIMG